MGSGASSQSDLPPLVHTTSDEQKAELMKKCAELMDSQKFGSSQSAAEKVELIKEVAGKTLSSSNLLEKKENQESEDVDKLMDEMKVRN